MDETEVLDAPDPAVESASTPVTDAAPEASTPEPTSEGPARDEHGRFVARQETQPEGTATEPPPADTPASETPAGEAQDAVAGAVPTDEPKPEPVPWSVRALGTDYVVDGAFQHPDGSITVSAEGVQRMHQLFGRAVLLNKRTQEIERDRADVRAKHAAAEAFAKPLMDRWATLKQAQTIEEFTEAAAAMFLERSVIDKEMELARDRAADLAYKEPPPVSPDEYRDAIERDLETELTASVQTAQAAPWAKGLTGEDWQHLARDMRRVRGSFVVQQEDGLYFNEEAALDYVRDRAQWILGERQKLTATARQAQDAARKNAAATVSAVKAPPGVGTSAPSGKPAAASAKPQQSAPNRPKSREEKEAERARYERWVMTGRED